MSTFTPEDFGFTFLEEGTSVQDVIDQRIKALSTSDAKNAFFVADLGKIVRKYLTWVCEIPRVTPFYAVKCNPSRPVVMTLAALGAGFDCASQFEMDLVKSLGVDTSRIIYAHTIKERSHLKYAAANGIKMMTFDNEAELVKIAQCCENVKLVLRIAVEGEGSMYEMSRKFGAKQEKWPRLLKFAQERGLDIIGVSFHVGSYCMTPVTYTKAIATAHGAFEIAEKHGYKMTLLDIGGGFPGFDIPRVNEFKQYAAEINQALDKYFPASTGVQVISEPGRYFPSMAYTLAVNVIGKRVDPTVTSPDALDPDTPPYPTIKEDGFPDKISYYVNDGLYSSFRDVVFPYAYVLPSAHKKGKSDQRFFPSTVYGQTCDGDDLIVLHYDLPDIQEGEWMLFYHMGGYSITNGTSFNGFPQPETQYVISRNLWQCLQRISAAKGDRALVQEVCHNIEPDGCCNVKPVLARKLKPTGKEGK